MLVHKWGDVGDSSPYKCKRATVEIVATFLLVASAALVYTYTGAVHSLGHFLKALNESCEVILNHFLTLRLVKDIIGSIYKNGTLKGAIFIMPLLLYPLILTGSVRLTDAVQVVAISFKIAGNLLK